MGGVARRGNVGKSQGRKGAGLKEGVESLLAHLNSVPAAP